MEARFQNCVAPLADHMLLGQNGAILANKSEYRIGYIRGILNVRHVIQPLPRRRDFICPPKTRAKGVDETAKTVQHSGALIELQGCRLAYERAYFDDQQSPLLPAFPP